MLKSGLNQFKRSHLTSKAFVLAGGLLQALSLTALASPIHPSWTDSTGANEAYLSDIGHRMAVGTELDGLFDPNDASRLHKRFEQMNEKYERMRNRGTFSPTYQAAEMDEMGKYREDAQGSVTSYQQTFYSERVKNAALADENIGRLKGPLGFIFGIAAIYNGVPVQWKMTDDARFSASTQKGKSAQCQVATPILTGTFEFSSEAAAQSSPLDPTPADPLYHPERYKVGASRSLSFWDLSSSVSYGSSTESLTTALSKKLTTHVTASVEQVHPLGAGDSYVTGDEGRVRMDYSLNF